MIHHNKSVAIVGSGLSGLTAACLLRRLGFSVTVFEANDRIGGRIFSVWDGRTQLALGAMWLHGGASNPIYPLVKRLGLLDTEQWQQRQDNMPDLCEQTSTYQYDWSQCACVTDSGESIDCSLVRQAEQEVRKHLADAYELSPRAIKRLYSDRMGAFVESKFPQDVDSTVYGASLRTFALFYANVEGVHSLNDLSIVGGSEYSSPDGQCLVEGGMAGLVEALAEQLPADCVRLNSPVSRISLSADGSASLLIDSQWHEFDHAVVTVSLGVLQAGQLIEPSLVTHERQLALNQMRMGLVDKIFVRLALPIQLPDNCNHLWIVRQKFNGNWLDGLTALSVVNRTRDTFILWLAGSYAAEMERQTAEQLEAMLTPYLESALRCRLPRILRLWRSSFGQDPHFLGSYSSYKPGCQPGATGRLAKPIEFGQADGNKPAICFAGEHTTEKHYATVQGAFLSGVREARRLAKYYKLAEAKSDLAAMI